MSKLSTLFRYIITPKKFHSRKKIEKIQNRGMKKQIKFVRKNSPFFARHWKGLPDDEWSKFPLIDKSIMMDNLSDLFSNLPSIIANSLEESLTLLASDLNDAFISSREFLISFSTN